jgi:hypothetical protein
MAAEASAAAFTAEVSVAASMAAIWPAASTVGVVLAAFDPEEFMATDSMAVALDAASHSDQAWATDSTIRTIMTTTPTATITAIHTDTIRMLRAIHTLKPTAAMSFSGACTPRTAGVGNPSRCADDGPP